jgi:hypothetical protein
MDTYKIKPIVLEFNSFSDITNESQRDYLVNILMMNLSLLDESNKGLATYLIRSLCIVLDPYDLSDSRVIDRIKSESKRIGILIENF